MKNICLFITIILLLTSCHIKIGDNSSELNLYNYEKVTIDKDYYETRVLRVFPYKGKPFSSILSANVYLCYFVKYKDTILIIDTKNKDVPSFIKDIDIKDYILHPNNTNICPEKVRVCLPKDYLLHPHFQCLCGTLSPL